MPFVKVKLPATCPCIVQVEIEAPAFASESELEELAREKFEDDPRSAVVLSYQGHSGISDPKDAQLTD